MKIKNLVTALALSTVAMGSLSNTTNAEYITAYEEQHYEKYVVDTNSIYCPDPNHKLNKFNCLVWFYDKPDQEKGTAFTFKYVFEDNTWKIAESVKNAEGKEEVVWNKLEDNSIASNVLRIALPFIGHTEKTK